MTRVLDRHRPFRWILVALALLLVQGSVSPLPFQENPSTGASFWVHPVPSSTDHFSAKEGRRLESGWKNFTSANIKKALHEWESLFKKHSHSPALLTALSYIDFAQQQSALALPKLEAALKADPRYEPALRVLARYYNDQRDYQKAYAYAAQLLELRPHDSQLRSELEGLRLLTTEKLIAEARAARSQAQWKDAESRYLEALKSAPELGSLSRELGDIYFYEAKWGAAEKCYSKAIQLDASDAEARKKLAEVYLHLNQPDQARKILDPLSTQSSQDEEVKSMLGKILAHSDPIDEALNAVRQKPQISRGDFGAMLGVRFPFLKELLKSPPVILTDLDSHWGKQYLPIIAGLELIPPLPNHQFRPHSILRRYEVAAAVDRLLTLLNRRPHADLSPMKIPDVPRTNPHRNSIDRVVAIRLMQLDTNGRFNPMNGISGGDALKILDSVENILKENSTSGH